MQILKKIDIPLLVVDILLIVFATFVSRYLFTERDILHHWRPWQLFTLFVTTASTVSWYLGYQYAGFSAYYGKLVSNIVVPFFGLLILVMMIYIARLFYSMIIVTYNSGSLKQALGLLCTFVFIAPAMSIGGYFTGKETGKGTYKVKGTTMYSSWDDDILDIMDLSSPGFAAVSVIFVLVMSIGIMAWLASFVKDHIILFVFVFLGSVLIACGIFCLFIWLRFLLGKTVFYKPLATLCFNSIPVIIVTQLAVLTGFILDFERPDKISAGMMVTKLLITGLLPFRVIMLFSPPFKLVNFLTGIFALSYFVIKIIQLSL